MNLDGIKSQLGVLEASNHIITLPTGRLMKSTDSIVLFYKMAEIEAKYDRGPLISNFSQEDGKLIRGLALWQPDSRVGAIIVFLCEQSQIILNNSFGISIPGRGR